MKDRGGLEDAVEGAELAPANDRTAARVVVRGDDLPVVARLVVEIRSDGRRTVARGAMEDLASGQAAAVEVHGDSPLQLALSLARTVFTLPALARTAARGLLTGRRRR